MEIINLTPHNINIVDDKGTPLRVFEPSGTVARVNERRMSRGFLDDIRLYAKSYGEVENLPDPIPGTVFIVSNIVMEAEQNRTDLVCPDEFTRDQEGKIIGCKSLWYRG